MKILFDTSVLIASVVANHPDFLISSPWLEDAKSGRFQGFVSCHTLAEFYQVMTVLPLAPAPSCQDVIDVLKADVLSHAQIVELTFPDYEAVLNRLSQQNLRSGMVFDALIVQAALKSGVDKLLTLNSKHFARLWPNHTDQVINPNITQAP